MKRVIFCLVVLIIVLFDYLSISAQKVLDFNEIVSTAPVLRKVYIPKDVDEAMKVLDTLWSPKYRNKILGFMDPDFPDDSDEDGNDEIIVIYSMWYLNFDSRIRRYIESTYYTSPLSENIWSLIAEMYRMHLKDRNFDPEAYLRERYKGYRVLKTGRRYEKLDFYERIELFNAGFAVGNKVYFQYPFGCTSQEEADYIKQYIKDDFIIYSEKDKFPTGVIEKVDQKRGMVLIRITKTIDEEGVIVFAGNVGWKGHKVIPFYNNSSDRILLKKGDKIWYPAHELYDWRCHWFTKKQIKNKK